MMTIYIVCEYIFQNFTLSSNKNPTGQQLTGLQI